eukprot:4682136-Prymnesium_polylepis.2
MCVRRSARKERVAITRYTHRVQLYRPSLTLHEHDSAGWTRGMMTRSTRRRARTLGAGSAGRAMGASRQVSRRRLSIGTLGGPP